MRQKSKSANSSLSSLVSAPTILPPYINKFSLLVTVIWWNERRPGRKFPPGPIGVPILGYIPFLYPDTMTKLAQLKDKYGSVFSMKVGSDWWVVLNDMDSMRKAFIQDSTAGRPRHMLFITNNKYGVGFNEGPAWYEQRKFVVQQLKELGFDKPTMETLMQYEANDLIRHLEARSKKPLELKDILGKAVLNLSMLMSAGVKFTMDDPKLDAIYECYKKAYLQSELDKRFFFLPWLARTFPSLTKWNTVEGSIREFNERVIKKIIESHRVSYTAGQHRDFVDSYLDKMSGTHDPGSSFYGKAGDLNFLDSFGNLIIPGTVAILSSLLFAILYLTECRYVLKKLQAEITKVTGNTRIPAYAERQQMPYTEATMQELFRLSSIVAGAAVHSTTEDTEILGYKLPKGTIILPNTYQVHHEKEYWGDPEEFRPERFINPDGTFRKDDAVHPFGTGKRTCIAKNTAPLILFVYLTSLVQAFDFYEHPDYPLPPFPADPGMMLFPKQYKVVLIPRADAPPRRSSSYMPNGF